MLITCEYLTTLKNHDEYEDSTFLIRDRFFKLFSKYNFFSITVCKDKKKRELPKTEVPIQTI